MFDPVATESGMLYDRKHIESWFKNHDIDPCTRQKIHKNVSSVNYVKCLIIEILETADKKV